MVSDVAINVVGGVGGAILAVCQAPQLIKLYRTGSAADLSYAYIALYTCGLMFICIYLYLEHAIVGFVCEVIEFSCGVTLIAAKFYLDSYGPFSPSGGQKLQEEEDSDAAVISAAELCCRATV